MATTTSRFSVKSTNLFIIFSSVLLVITIAIRLFMDLYVFPALDNFIEIYIPAKTGGESYYVDPGEFAVTGIVSIIVAALFTGMIVFFAKTGKTTALILAMIANFTFALLYFAVMFGNIAHAFWGGWWSVAGVVATLVVVFGLEIIAFMNIKIDRSGPSAQK